MHDVQQKSFPPSTQLPKYLYIDVLRGLAIFGVIAVHSHQYIQGLPKSISWIFNYGQSGVQLFFVASAVTLCLSMSRRKEGSLRNFYIRRYFRIAPLYYLGIPLYLIWGMLKLYYVSGLFTIPPQYSALGILSNVLFVHGFYAPANNNIVPGGWSIATEMTFYAIFPSLYYLQSKLSNLKYFLCLVLAVGLFFGIELIGYMAFGKNPDNTTIIYFGIENQLGVFLIGILAFRLLNVAKIGWGSVLAALFASAISCMLYNGFVHSGFDGFFGPLLSSFAFFVLTIKLSRKKEFGGPIWKALAKLGEVSYSMYLLQFLFLDLINYLLKRTVFGYLKQADAQLFVFFFTVLFVTYLFSRISKRIIEEPGILLGKRFLIKSTQLEFNRTSAMQ